MMNKEDRKAKGEIRLLFLGDGENGSGEKSEHRSIQQFIPNSREASNESQQGETFRLTWIGHTG